MLCPRRQGLYLDNARYHLLRATQFFSARSRNRPSCPGQPWLEQLICRPGLNKIITLIFHWFFILKWIQFYLNETLLSFAEIPGIFVILDTTSCPHKIQEQSPYFVIIDLVFLIEICSTIVWLQMSQFPPKLDTDIFMEIHANRHPRRLLVFSWVNWNRFDPNIQALLIVATVWGISVGDGRRAKSLNYLQFI